MRVPPLNRSQIEDAASDLILGYEISTGRPACPPIPVEDIIERYLDLRLGFVDFHETVGSSDILGATYLEERLICANESLLRKGSEGRLNFTFAHEAGHWVLHRKLVVSVPKDALGRTAILCRSGDARKPIEWQADYFAACLLMPARFVLPAFETSFGTKPLVLVNVESHFSGPCYVEPCVCNWPHIAQAVSKAGRFDNVSKQAVIIRLQELGLVVNETAMPMNWKSIRLSTATA
jgi:hypothetical protein